MMASTMSTCPGDVSDLWYVNTIALEFQTIQIFAPAFIYWLLNWLLYNNWADVEKLSRWPLSFDLSFSCFTLSPPSSGPLLTGYEKKIWRTFEISRSVQARSVCQKITTRWTCRPPRAQSLSTQRSSLLIYLRLESLPKSALVNIVSDSTRSSSSLLNQVHPETFTLDLSLYIKLAWADNRIEFSNGSVNVDQSFMGLVSTNI